MCKYVGPVMKAQKSGKIVYTSSMASRGESQAGSAYGAAKAGIISFTRKFCRELGPCGINCNGIAPALVLTNRINKTIGAVSPEVAAERARNIPIRRNSMPEDQALVVAFRASSDGRHDHRRDDRRHGRIVVWFHLSKIRKDDHEHRGT
jgi:NAD(P)-dependent dehydrogenase (short-subunit alcohol dehydrogenase family)